MADIFNRTITLGPVLSGELLRLTFGTDNGGMIAQRVVISQQRPLNIVMDAKDGSLVTVLGIPAPYTAEIQGLVASASQYKNFIQTFGTGCTSQDSLQVTVTAPVCGSTPPATTTYTLKNPRIVGVAAQVDVGGYVYIASITLAGPAVEIS